MPVLHFLYFPIDVNTRAEGFVFPTVDTDVQAISQLLTSKDAQAADDGNNNNNHHNNRPPEYNILNKFHKDKEWITLLAWSHGVSNSGGGRGGNFQDLSMTRYRDKLSPIIKAITLKGETLPRALFRAINMPKNDRLSITEFDMENVRISSQSSGGSGGEDKLTENISVDCTKCREVIYEINLELGEIASQTFCNYDSTNNIVTRTSLNNTAKTLVELAKETLLATQNLSVEDKETLKKTELVEDYELKELEEKEEEEPVYYGKSANKKRKVLVSTENDIKKYRSVEVADKTRDALIHAVAAKFGIDAAQIVKVYQKYRDDALVEIETDDDAKDIEQEAFIVINIK